MKTYFLRRDVFGIVTVWRERKKRSRQLKVPGLHSFGFEVGYEGSGPAETALAILADFYGETTANAKRGRDSRAWAGHQEFKRDVIAKIQIEPGREAVLSDEQICDWMVEKELPTWQNV